MMRTIVSAVDYFHQMDVIHRDLKPENFVLKTKAKDAPICAIDFGLSTFYHENRDVYGIRGKSVLHGARGVGVQVLA